ncbi:Rieske 2Fe-2S domain-containing protein [Variovorax sp. WS11]|uniref:aromatic ring-hydroxylating oxygenase subunit alpha n=2 Tax=Variovorax sp. WS11 TaxID=1105204 RepID=UPI001EF25C15|nr:Rieske 2Fe-2S domain-containing protein [Variovorax sp. WS11]
MIEAPMTRRGMPRQMVNDDAEAGSFRVHRGAFVDEEVLQRERSEIFDRCWLYAMHESELAKPGDYLARKVGGKPLMFVRDRAGVLRGFFNACPHRGMTLCREKSGTARNFSCFYHGWTFDLQGQLVALPDSAGYAGGADPVGKGLKPVPRMEIYRGLVFINFDAGACSLEAYLGNAKEYIDLMLDFGGDEVDIAPGQQRYSIRSNWKLLVENSIDVYHAHSTHNRYFSRFLPDMGLPARTWLNVSDQAPGRAIALDNGHAVAETLVRSGPLLKTAANELAEVRQRLVEKFGEERAARIADYGRNLLIFPNLLFISTWRTIRTIYPVAPGYMEVDAWALLPRSESAHLKKLRMDNFISFLGPAGFGTPDDVSGLESCQRGFFEGADSLWSDISRGMHRDPVAADELQMRAFWRRWQTLLDEAPAPTTYGDARLDPVADDCSHGPECVEGVDRA